MSRISLRIGHRGAPRIAPGNTMASFSAAWECGCDWVECDCRASRDGVVVLAHDARVTDRAGRVWQIEAHTAAELAGLDLGQGQGVPTLAELVEWARGKVGLMADIKTGGLERPIGALLTGWPPETVLVPGADDAGRAAFRALYPALPLSLTVDAGHADELERRLPEQDTEAVTLEWPLVTPARIRLLRRRGIRVFAWTVDELARMRQLAEMGLDGIISNRADLLASL